MFVDRDFLVMLAACTLGIAYAIWTFFGLKGVAIWFALVVGAILYTERERTGYLESALAKEENQWRAEQNVHKDDR